MAKNTDWRGFHLLDFFVNILLGDQMDKIGHLMGTPYYEKAKIIAEQATHMAGLFAMSR